MPGEARKFQMFWRVKKHVYPNAVCEIWTVNGAFLTTTVKWQDGTRTIHGVDGSFTESSDVVKAMCAIWCRHQGRTDTDEIFRRIKGYVVNFRW